MPNQIEKMITDLEEMSKKVDGGSIHTEDPALIAVIEISYQVPQLLKILKAHKFLLEGVGEMDIPNHKVNDIRCTRCDCFTDPSGDFYHLCDQWRTQRDNLIKTHNEML